MGRAGYGRADVAGQEAVVLLYKVYGPQCVHLLRGDFALALYDTRRGRLWLARNALGTRPLYYAIVGQRLFFGSRVAPLLDLPEVSRDPDPVGLWTFLRAGIVPPPRTFFRAVHKLGPGQSLLADEAGVRMEQHWAPVLADVDRPVSATVAAEQCARMVDDAVAQCLSRVNEVTVLVDGGSGSALIAAAAAKQPGSRVQALVAVVDDPLNPRRLDPARGLAGIPALELVQERLAPSDAEHHLLEIVGFLAEPPPSESLLLDEWACRSTAVSDGTLLRADGAGELLGASGAGAGPAFRRSARHLLGGGPFIERLRSRVARRPLATSAPGELTAARSLGPHSVFSADELGRVAPGLESTPGESVLRGAADALMAGAGNEPASRDIAARVGMVLPEASLAPIAGVATALGVDARWPFLDRRLVEAVNGLPPRLKVPGLGDRSLLQRMARTRLPRQPRLPNNTATPVLFRPGGVPALAAELLAPDRLRRTGYFRPEVVTQMLDEHRHGRRGLDRRLWVVLGVQLWHSLLVDRGRAP